MNIQWKWSKFNQLSVNELYSLLKLRQDVFIVEQRCIYPDLDGNDQAAWHVLGYHNKQLIAYARILVETVNHTKTIWLRRVVTATQVRNQGIGKQLMRLALDWCHKQYPHVKIKIQAQLRLAEFYQTYKFVTTSTPYDYEGIMHIDMELTHATSK